MPAKNDGAVYLYDRAPFNSRASLAPTGLHKPIHQRPAPRQKLPLPITLGLMTDGGKIAIELPGGEERRFLESCDEVILRARCQREGQVSIGFGECRGVVIG